MPSLRDQLLQFDPNQPNTSPWATYSPQRATKFKTHTSRAIALNALSMWHDLCALYQFVDGEWVCRGMKDCEGRNCVCDICKLTTVTHIPSGYSTWGLRCLDGKDMYDTGKFDWKRNKHKIATPLEMLYLCRACYTRNR